MIIHTIVDQTSLVSSSTQNTKRKNLYYGKWLTFGKNVFNGDDRPSNGEHLPDESAGRRITGCRIQLLIFLEFRKYFLHVARFYPRFLRSTEFGQFQSSNTNNSREFDDVYCCRWLRVDVGCDGSSMCMRGLCLGRVPTQQPTLAQNRAKITQSYYIYSDVVVVNWWSEQNDS